MENKDTKEYKYDAFISYRHAELDQFVAENLHKLLETFKVPRIAADSIKKQKKSKISRVFRDRDELPLSSNLSDNIQSALEASEYLIVICSPRTPESLWVQKEIKTFISLHGRNKVLAVLIEGEPDQAFPKELCFETVEQVLEDGTKVMVEQEVEPLAADVRGKNKKEVYKNLKKELLRLAAPLLGCSYDDLKQRHRERKIKRMMAASLAAAAVFFVFGSISAAMALQIHKQSEVIQEQSEEIEAQYQEVLKRQAYTLVDTSTELLEEGNRIAAILVAKEALTEMPYTEQAQYALTEAVRVYENGSIIMPIQLLKMSTNLDFFEVSLEGNRILTMDITGKITVWEALEGTEVCTILSGARYGVPDENEVGFIDEKHIFFPKDKDVIIYNIEEQKEEYSLPFEAGYIAVVNEQTRQIAIGDGKKISLINLENYTVAMEYTPEEEWNWMRQLVFNESGTLLACSVEELNSPVNAMVLDTQTGECVSEMAVSDRETGDLLFVDEEHLVFAWKNDYREEIPNTIVECREARTGTVDWNVQIDNKWVTEFVLLGNKKALACCSYGEVRALDVESGEEIIKANFDSSIAGCVPLGEQNIFLVLRDGKAIYVSEDLKGSYDNSNIFMTNSDNMAEFKKGTGFYATRPYGSNAVTVYQATMGSGAEGIAEFINTIHSAVYDKKEETYLVHIYGSTDYGNAYLVDAKTNEKLAGFEMDTRIEEVFFIGENEEQIGIFTADALYFYDRNGNYLRQMEYEDFNSQLVSVSEDGRSFVVRMGDTLKCIDSDTLEVIAEFQMESSSVNFAMVEKYCAVISEKEEELQVYDFTTAEKKKSIPINYAFVYTVCMDETEKLIFVTYQDKTVEVYDRETLELQKTFTEFEDEVLLCKNSKEKNIYFLYGTSHTYVCKADNLEVIARIPNFEDIAPSGESVLVAKNNTLMKIPFYELDELLEEAERQLKGRVLSEEERERYHLGKTVETEETTETVETTETAESTETTEITETITEEN